MKFQVFPIYQIMTDRERLKINLIQHLDGSKYENREDIVRIVEKHFPQYLYAGIAYRVIKLRPHEEFDSKKLDDLRSWAMNKEGVDHYITNFSPFASEYDLLFVEGNVLGVSIARLLQEEFPEIKEMEDLKTFIKEDEILVNEVIGYQITDLKEADES